MVNIMNNVVTSEPKSQQLKKHVNTIHCSNNLTLVQRKIFNSLLFNAYPDLPYKQQFEIKSKELTRLIGFNSKDTTLLKKALLGLIKTTIEWNVLDSSTNREKKWSASSILAAAEISNGVCVYEYSQMMKELLYQPETYGKINMEYVSQFKSNYGLALYENCIRYQGLPQTPWFSLDIFKKLMGISEEKYAFYRELKKRVVDVAVKEINSITSISVIPEVERVNQKVTKIRFKLNKALPLDGFKTSELMIDDDLNEILTSTFGLSKQTIREDLAKFEQDFIREKVDMILASESFRAGRITGLAGYLVNALKKDFKPSKSSKSIVDAIRKEQKENEVRVKKVIEGRDAKYEIYIRNCVDKYLKTLNEEQSKKVQNVFEKQVKLLDRFIYSRYQKDGCESPLVKGIFLDFMLTNYREQIGVILTKTEFMSLIDESN